MSAISLKSITGITSITTPAGVDNQLTLHNNNTTEAIKLDNAGNLHINNQLAIAGVTTISNDLHIKSALPRIYLTDTNHDSDWYIGNSDGTIIFYDTTLTNTRFEIYPGNSPTTRPFIGTPSTTDCRFDGFVRIGAVGTSPNHSLTVGGNSNFSGISTFVDIDVDGHTNLDNVSISGVCTATAFVSDTPLSHRNLVINGDHRISQRGTAAVTVTTTAGYRCVDRFKSDIDGSGGGDFSHAQSTDVPAGQGFTHSSKITTVTQVSQPSGTSNRHQLYTMLEKQDVAHLGWGTSNAKTCTLSFWVKSSITGTYILWFRHYGGTTHSYYTNYTIDSANTWEKKTITLTGYTSGGNVTGTLNDQGILIEWNLGTSSGNETGTLNEWTTSSTIRAASGSVYLPENAGATWYLTGCQFEVGSVVTPFEHRSFAEELVRCQRYYYVIGDARDSGTTFQLFNCHAYSTVQLETTVHYPVMRATPSLVQGTGTGYMSAVNASGTITFNSWIMYHPSPRVTLLYQNSNLSSNPSTGASYRGQLANSNAYVHLEAEL